MRSLRIAISISTAIALLALAGRTVEATSYVVDNLSDSPFLTACTAAPNDCSLRGAISNAATNPGADSITADPATPPGPPTGGVRVKRLPLYRYRRGSRALAAGRYRARAAGAEAVMRPASER